MRRDTQIGIILGIVILVIIGVFLSTRTNSDVPQIPELVLSEGVSKPLEVEEISINDLIEKEEIDETSTIGDATVEPHSDVESVESIPLLKQLNETIVDTNDDNTSLEGKWEGIPEAIVEKPKYAPEQQLTDEIKSAEETVKTDESQIAEEVPYDKVEEETFTADQQHEHIASVGNTTKSIHKVKANDSLFKISKKYYGDEGKWDIIFEANKDTMSNPHAIYVGQELIIPEVTVRRTESQPIISHVEKTEEQDTTVSTVTHTVQSGDSLYRIAGKYYDDPAKWEKIYEANKDEIDDQGLLMKGQILVIPQ